MTNLDSLEISGGRKLSGGRISIAGSSNQVTKCIIASMLTDEDVIIKDAPVVDERRIVEGLFTSLGGEIKHIDEGVLKFNGKTLQNHTIPKTQCQKNRISVLTAGPLLHRFGKVSFYGVLGGDRIGKRPVNFHIEALRKMGAHVEYDDDNYHLSVEDHGLRGAQITLPFPSVMTTENILIAATLAKGRTIIENAAIEPEIIELTKMLQKMGADISLDANRTFIIEGVKKLRGCEVRCMVDRNQVVSFAVAALATGGDVFIKGVPHDPVYNFLNFIQRMGAEFKINSEGLYVKAPAHGGLLGTHIEVDVHPGFMTDWQQPFMVLFTQARGISIIHETVFEERLGYTDFLNKMGASITVSTKCLGEVPCRYRNRNYIHSAIIQGGTPLHCGSFSLPTDIRAGKCLVIAALVADGTTKLTNIHELERKYDNLVPKLQEMGASIKMVTGK
ncbi:MAG: UDP-N-acetylglucosamine 1-carboxyvinyltransferase [Oligoflexales bacterium]|nr:UDP-N-acetylglucosamine 1-carboxyvinyltransferase [Oligoflexales bacterium]